ncbi:PACE efflux transporter [Photobacterium sanguinicancri]|uniref:PACE efflux transporter n=1 Tax=Photobacterium sanguinicancri TaxID=875932 RepID=A0AAW7Y5Q2_9GAMM|nr:PACE efflux transporter [Photobacterium sanguinicancri]MDO6543330.1 PACE efflux transporter [Photobacterium sanguinicancri]
MRTTLDRIRHTIGFEVIALLLITFVVSHLVGLDPKRMGAMGLGFSIIATVWNYSYNLMFDKAMLKRFGTTVKSGKIRVVHAIIFELCLLVITLPVMAWWLNMTLYDALILDLGMVVFFLFYAYGYNLAYDKLFPIHESAIIETPTNEPQFTNH